MGSVRYGSWGLVEIVLKLRLRPCSNLKGEAGDDFRASLMVAVAL
jgi:hypothetical protein